VGHEVEALVSAEAQARFITLALLGDKDWKTPKGTKAWTYFAQLSEKQRWEEFAQLYYDFPAHEVPRDLLERMGEDR
jgi:hypothetical protein